MQLPFFLANRFVAAETLEGTLPVVRDLNRKGLRVALDHLGEHVHDPAVAREATDTYIHVIRTLANEHARHPLDVDLSIKLSMIGQCINTNLCRQHLLQVLSVAEKHDIFVQLDMEGSALTQSTLELFKDAHREYPNHVGPVLQAYLKRTERDVKEMCRLNARVRLCKGAYKEPAGIAYQEMPVIRQKFIQHMKRLITSAHYPGIATHDDTLLEATKAFVAQQGFSRDRFEFQMLYGIRPQTQEELVQEGYNMLVYVPFGTDWLPYFSRRLRERKENVWFVLKNLFRR